MATRRRFVCAGADRPAPGRVGAGGLIGPARAAACGAVLSGRPDRDGRWWCVVCWDWVRGTALEAPGSLFDTLEGDGV